MTDKASSGKRIRVKLTKADWQEIYYALIAKAIGISSGTYGAETRPGQDRTWIRDLRRIVIKIGLEGVRASKCGVARAK
jgi:hypothetical protein